MRRVLHLVSLLALCLPIAACGGDEPAERREPCFRVSHCPPGYSCSAGYCRSPRRPTPPTPAAVDAGQPAADTGTNQANQPDAGRPAADAGLAPPGPDAGAPLVDAGPPPVEDDPWAFVVLPDTEHLTDSNPSILNAQTQWIRDNAISMNIRFVIHTGDLANNTDAQWGVVDQAFSTLDGRIPYALALGHSDYGLNGGADRRESSNSRFFGSTRFAVFPSFGGTFEVDDPSSNYHRFDTPDGPYLVIVLEFAPRPAVLTWAQGIIDENPNLPIILVTHCYLNNDGLRFGAPGETQAFAPSFYSMTEPDGADGQMIHQQLVLPNPRIALVLSGHALDDGTGLISSQRGDGSHLHEVMANYEFMPDGGSGYLRIYRVHSDRFAVSTYSPHLDEFLSAADQQFDLPR